LDSVTLEDWGEEIFAEGVGVKWRKWARGKGRGRKNTRYFSPHPSLYAASAPTLYRLQSKMEASNRFI